MIQMNQEPDISDRLRDMPCVAFCRECMSVVDDAIEEIEALRLAASFATSVCDRSSDEMMKSLSNAIMNTEPCGRSDCISVGPKFLSSVRNEMARLREIVALGACVAMAAKAAWLKSNDANDEMDALIAAVRRFEEARA